MYVRGVGTHAFVSLSLLILMNAYSVGGLVAITEKIWDGEYLKGEKAVELRNSLLSATILLRGGWIISIRDARSGEDYINAQRSPKYSEHNGIYDRINSSAQHSYHYDDSEHLRNAAYELEKLGENTIRLTCEKGKIRVVREVSLDPSLPRIDLRVTYTNISPSELRTRIVTLIQPNTGPDEVSFNDVVVFPHGNGVERVRFKPASDKTPTEGWCFATDYRTRQTIILTYKPATSGIAELYTYKVAPFYHIIPFGEERVLQSNRSLSQFFSLYFLTGEEDVKGLTASALKLEKRGFRRLRKALISELHQEPTLPGQERKLALPRIKRKRVFERVRQRPLATVLYVRSALYDRPDKLDARSWLSLPPIIDACAEARAIKPTLLILGGASASGLSGEMQQMHKLAELSACHYLFLPSRSDLSQLERFRREFGDSTLEVFHLPEALLLGYAPGAESFIKKKVEESSSRWKLLFGESLPRDFLQELEISAGFFPLNTTVPSFEMVGRVPVFHNPTVQASSSYAVVRIYRDYLDIQLGKPLGGSFAPHCYLLPDGSSPPLGIPPFIKGVPFLKVAHITDTQLSDRTYNSRYYRDDLLDRQNLENAVKEINRIGVDLVFNTGDLVNVGSHTAEWELYRKLTSELKPPLYEVLGNHDWDEVLPDKTVVAKNFLRYTGDELLYTVERKGVLFVCLGCSIDSIDFLSSILSKARKARYVVVLSHSPFGGGYWNEQKVKAVLKLKPEMILNGHTHRLAWRVARGIPEFTGSALGWTKTGDQRWNGFFIHSFFDHCVVSSFKRLSNDRLYLTTVLRRTR